MNRISRDVLANLDRINRTPIVRAARRVKSGLPGVRVKGHEPRPEPKPYGSSRFPKEKVHKGELRPATWRDPR